MLTKEEAKGRVIRVATAGSRLGLFECSSIMVGQGFAGRFLDDNEGAVVPLANMAEVVDLDAAGAELERWMRAKDKARIKEVVLAAGDSQQEFEGTIVLHVGFTGSLAKTKALTKEEMKVSSVSLASAGVDPAKVKGSKTLFSSAEYDAIEAFKSKRRQEFANLGIPFPLGDSMYLIRIVNIPKAEELAQKTERELQALVASLQGVYSSQITPEAVGLGPLYNAGDYRAPEALESLFKFKSKWMHFGTPDILKEIDMALWERERSRTVEVWNEARQQGLILLRETTAGMVRRLVEAVTPNPDGTRKRFYATAVTGLTEFFDAFEDRNIAGDKDLADMVARLRDLVAGVPVDSFRTDEELRASVQAEGAKISEALESMLVASGARRIKFED